MYRYRGYRYTCTGTGTTGTRVTRTKFIFSEYFFRFLFCTVVQVVERRTNGTHTVLYTYVHTYTSNGTDVLQSFIPKFTSGGVVFFKTCAFFWLDSCWLDSKIHCGPNFQNPCLDGPIHRVFFYLLLERFLYTIQRHEWELKHKEKSNR